MFYRYEIKEVGSEEVLYLYLTMAYEFSKELGVEASDTDIKRRTKNFVKNNKIEFKGHKAFLVIDGIIVKTVDLDTEDYGVEVISEKHNYSDAEFLVTIEMDNHIIIEITLKEYLLGVLATNTTTEMELEALKSLAVLYRTYALKEMQDTKKIIAINRFQIYKPLSYYKLAWLQDYNSTYHKLLRAVEETDREFVSYDNSYITPFVHICSNGYTSTDPSYLYLEKRPSLWDYASPQFLKVTDYTYEQLEDIFKKKKEEIKNMEILSLTENNRIKEIKVGEEIIDGVTFKKLLNLPSDDITIIINEKNVRFITRGYGISLGLSQFGANEMAKNNCSYTDIIRYYYPSVMIKRFV